MSMTVCTPRCGPNAGSPLPGNNPPPVPGTGNGLPEGGNIGDIIVNTGPGQGEWQPNTGGGEPGPPGESAYEIAVAEGFVGTEAEWLESLVGEQGPQGIQGPDGPQGSEGPQGPEGDVGPQGPAGADGEQGLQGPAGPQGAPGVQGASLTIDEYGNLDEAKVTAIETADVDWWFLVNPGGDDRVNQTLPAGISGDMERHLIVYRASDNSWSDYGQFTGIQGPAGPQGPQGVQGPNGTPGAPGAPGPQGSVGPAGPQGPVGPAGISAYQVAVNNGFVGTESAWLASLEGPQGPQGIQGIQGIQGPEGDPGPAGAPATTQPTYDLTMYNDTVVPAGIYPVTINQPIAWTFTKLAHKTEQGTIATIRLIKNGVVAATINGITTTRVISTINVATVAGDILTLELVTVSGVRTCSFAIS